MPEDPPTAKYEREKVGDVYLDINQQFYILSKLHQYIRTRPWNEYTIARQGGIIAAGATASVGYCMWSMGYRTMGMKKYGKGGISALLATLIPAPLFAGYIHENYVSRNVFSAYRSENSFIHGLRSLWIHQISIVHASLCTWGWCFYNAFRFELTPTRDDLTKLDSWRYNIKYFYREMKPVSKYLKYNYVLSSIFMFIIGYKEHRQSVEALRKIGYKSVVGGTKW